MIDIAGSGGYPSVSGQHSTRHVPDDLRVILDLRGIMRKDGLGNILGLAGTPFFEKFLDHHRLVDVGLPHLLRQQGFNIFVCIHTA
jgi:hypothetical protein